MIYGNKLKEIRTYEDIKQTELSKIIGLSNAAYSEFERENTIIPLKHLIKICDYFNVSLDYIFEFSNIKCYPLCTNGINKNKLKTRLKEFRLSENLSQEKLANILNVSTSVIAGAEQGRRLIATPFLYAICKKYNISADYLLGRTDNPNILK